MRTVLLLSILFTLIFTTCDQTSPAEIKGISKKASDGTEYIVFSKGDCVKPKDGEYAYFHIRSRIGDIIFSDTRESTENTPAVQIKTDISNYNIEILRDLCVGDSATFSQSTAGLMNIPKGYELEEKVYFDMVLMDIKSVEEHRATQSKINEAVVAKAKAYKARVPEIDSLLQSFLVQFKNKSIADLKSSESGLSYVILDPGKGRTPEAQKTAAVHYYGILMDGKMVDNTFFRGMPLNMLVGDKNTLPGWEESIKLLKEGGKGVFFVPSKLAYGEKGNQMVAGNSDLVYYIELARVY